MNKVTTLAIVALIGAGLVFSQGARAESMKVGNKICPVSGEKVPAAGEKGAMGEGAEFEHNGKIYSLCCPMCVKDFKKDPAKYSAIADKEVSEQK